MMKPRMRALCGALGLVAGVWLAGAGHAHAQTPTADAVMINEILAHTDAPQDDAIELHNPTAAAVDIGGWILADNSQANPRFTIPGGTVIPAGGYRVFEFDGDSPFRLSESGETVYLFRPGGGGGVGPLVESAKFGVSPNGVSFGPIHLSTGDVHQVLLQQVTLGATNAPPRIGPLIIDDLMYDPNGGRDEYVALRNVGGTSTLLCAPEAGNRSAVLRVDDEDVFTLPCGPMLEPGDRLYISGASPNDLRQQYNIPAEVIVVGPFDGRLSNDGELVELVWPQPPETDGIVHYFVLDQVDYLPAAPWPVLSDGASLLRRLPPGYGDDPVSWKASNEPPQTVRAWLPAVMR
jgi:hypothetical protein